MTTIHDLLQEKGYLVTDGAMGTVLFAAGLEQGDPPELWNISNPEIVTAVHRSYLDAGAQILLTNTFGGNRHRLALHNAQDQVEQANLAAAEICKRVVAENGREALIAGDIGPSGQVLAPYGELLFDDAVDGFEEQASALIQAGVDVIWIETMSDLEEVRAAVEAARRVSADIPIVTTMTFDTRGHTMMGVSPEKAIDTLSSFDPIALGGNCGNGPEEIVQVIEKMHSVNPQTLLVAKANAGVPQLVDGKPVYRATPERMAEYAIQVYQAGARIIGGCCGSTPDHIRSISGALADHTA